MSYITNILGLRNIKDSIPFWKLKLTSKEYNELKKYLTESIENNKSFKELDLAFDMAVYISEWWRRECCERNYIDGICKSLNTADRNPVINATDKIAEQGICNIYRANVNNQKIRSIMFQGGLPLKWIIDNTNTTNCNYWKKKLAGVRFDQEEQDNDETVAEKSKELAEFCEAIRDAYDKDRIDDMPFCCEDEGMYKRIVDIINGERERHRNENPFTISWEIRIDDIEKKLSVKYRIMAAERLSEDFISKYFPNNNRRRIQVYADNTLIKTFEYTNRIIGNREFYVDYDDTSIIKIKKANSNEKKEEEKIFISDYLALLSEPHFVYTEDEFSSTYRLGKKRNGISRCIIPEIWKITADNSKKDNDYNEYSYLGQKVIIIDFSNNREITIKNKETEEERNVCISNITKNVICTATPNIHSPFIEPIMDIKDYNDFKFIDEDGNTSRVRNKDTLLYRAINGKWQKEIPQGRILAIVQRDDETTHPTIPFINLSELPQCLVESSTANTCKIRFKWGKGTIVPDKSKLGNCRLLDSGEWEITKTYTDPTGVIPLLCTPNGQPPFTLHIDAPYNELIIYKPTFGNNPVRLRRNVKIPYCDLPLYRIAGVKRIRVTINRTTRYIDIDGSCSLEYIIGTMCDIRKLLDATLENVVRASTTISITETTYNPQTALTITIGEYPFGIWVNDKDGGKEIVAGENDRVNATLYLLPFEDPDKKIELRAESGRCLMPTELLEKRFLICCKHGYGIRPKKYPNKETNKGEGSNIDILEKKRKEKEEEKRKALSESKSLNDGNWTRILKWIQLCRKGIVHAQSLWDLKCILKEHSLLEKAAYILWTDTDGYKEESLVQFLLQLQEQLSFEWYWLPFNDCSFIGYDENIFNTACARHNVADGNYCNNQQPLVNQWGNFVEKLKQASRGRGNEIAQYIDAPQFSDRDNYKEIFGINQIDQAREAIPRYLQQNVNDINIVLGQDGRIRRAIIYYHKYDTGYFNAILNNTNI